MAVFFDAQAWHFDLSAVFEQGLAVLFVVLCVAQRHRHVEAAQGAAGFYAKRAGVELIQGQVLGGGIDLSLDGGGALLLAGAGEEVDEDNDLAEADSKGFDEHDGGLTGQGLRGRSLPDFSGAKKNRRSMPVFLGRIT